jgi:hypothetical protein
MNQKGINGLTCCIKQSTAFLARSIRCDLGNMQCIAKVIPGAKSQGLFLPRHRATTDPTASAK